VVSSAVEILTIILIWQEKKALLVESVHKRVAAPVKKAAQHSVHLTGGYAPHALRAVKRFLWLKPVPLKWRYLIPPASK